MTLQYNNGEIQIEEGVTLLNPKMDVIGVHYNIITNTFDLSVNFIIINYMKNLKLLQLLESVLGKGKQTSGNNIAFFSPFVSDYFQGSSELQLT